MSQKINRIGSGKTSQYDKLVDPPSEPNDAIPTEFAHNLVFFVHP